MSYRVARAYMHGEEITSWMCLECGCGGSVAGGPEAVHQAAAHECDAYRAALDWQEDQRRMAYGIPAGVIAGGSTTITDVACPSCHWASAGETQHAAGRPVAAVRNRDPACQCSNEGLRLRGGGHDVRCPAGTYYQDPVAEIRAAIAEPLGLDGGSLPAYGIPGPDGCQGCLGPSSSGALCAYCAALARLRAAETPSRHRSRRVPFPVVAAVILAGWILTALTSAGRL